MCMLNKMFMVEELLQQTQLSAHSCKCFRYLEGNVYTRITLLNLAILYKVIMYWLVRIGGYSTDTHTIYIHQLVLKIIRVAFSYVWWGKSYIEQLLVKYVTKQMNS